jgi:peptidoglycan-associated lipoprotein
MRTRIPAAASLAVVVALLTGLGVRGHADVRRYQAKVFVDRKQPSLFVPVDDFRVNETIIDEGGVRYVDVRGPDGVFRVPFSDIAEIHFLRLIGYMDTDVAMYDARVIGRTPDINRYGVVWLRVMLGTSSGQPWYLRPRTTLDRGARLRCVAFGDTTCTSMGVPPAETPAPPPVIPEPPKPVPPPEPPAVDPFAKLTLDQLNASNPLEDAFFDFDKSNIRPDAQLVLQRNATWLKEHPTTRVTIEGYADERGTVAYNLRLGERRAEATRRFLVQLGIAPDRLPTVTRGRTLSFCGERSEPCYQQNRRAHFVFTVK